MRLPEREVFGQRAPAAVAVAVAAVKARPIPSPVSVLEVLPVRCYLVTSLFAERYAALVTMYGSKLVPPMTSPRWITPAGTNTFVITSDGMAAFMELDFYSRQHLTP